MRRFGRDRRVAFYSSANNLVPGDGDNLLDVFVRDLRTGTTILASETTSGPRIVAHSCCPSISPNGNLVGFQADVRARIGDLANIVSPLRMSCTKMTSRSVSTSGGLPDYDSSTASLSNHSVAFESEADNLVPEATLTPMPPTSTCAGSSVRAPATYVTRGQPRPRGKAVDIFNKPNPSQGTDKKAGPRLASGE
jgi:hypothetical protein